MYFTPLMLLGSGITDKYC